jgi:hypothetical protein
MRSFLEFAEFLEHFSGLCVIRRLMGGRARHGTNGLRETRATSWRGALWRAASSPPWSAAAETACPYGPLWMASSTTRRRRRGLPAKRPDRGSVLSGGVGAISREPGPNEDSKPQMIAGDGSPQTAPARSGGESPAIQSGVGVPKGLATALQGGEDAARQKGPRHSLRFEPNLGRQRGSAKQTQLRPGR